MSGTSADGVTAALVQVDAKSLSVLRHRTYAYAPELKRRILGAAQGTVPELSRLNFELGEIFAEAAGRIARGTRPAVIGSHGQTVWHGPRDVPANTLQIAEAAVIAERTGLPTISDFRTRDVAAGGQGAPLVPAFDLFLYGSGGLTAVVNVGGIANVSLVGGGRLHAAFDTGPGNVLMDEAVRRATGGRGDFDRGGRWAAAGRVDENLLRKLLKHPFFRRLPPKSLDRSTFGPEYLSAIAPSLRRATLPDSLATLAELTARSLWLGSIENAPGEISRVVVSGGGALNAHLMRRLAALFSPKPVLRTELPVMAKEAACFAWLALRSLDGKSGNLPSATGARGPRILGKITA
jgi:anhydro-N-acetylmuramic acid kinase